MKRDKWVLGLAGAVLLTALSVGVGFAADWAGTYLTEDTKGHSFTIVLSDDTKARGEKDGHVLNGSWSIDGDSAVIKWTTGWTTKLTIDGDAYTKVAFRPGTPVTGEGGKPTLAKKVD